MIALIFQPKMGGLVFPPVVASELSSFKRTRLLTSPLAVMS